MLPSLQIGHLVAPAPLRAALRTATYTVDWHTALPAQAALARFIDDGLLARHVHRMRNAYAARHQSLTRTLTGRFTELTELVPSVAGLHGQAPGVGRGPGSVGQQVGLVWVRRPSRHGRRL
jgi:GntR family transcriptional regulator/MocR family aminotransferase